MWAKLVGASGLVVVSESVFRGLGKGELSVLGAIRARLGIIRTTRS